MCKPTPASAEGVEQDMSRPDEWALAASDEPSDGRALYERQDTAVQDSQDEWGSS